VGLPEQHGPSLLQAANDSAVLNRDEALENFRRAARLNASGAQHVLERHWNAEQRPALARSSSGIGGPSLFERQIGRDGQKRLHPLVNRLDALQMRSGQLFGRRLTGIEEVGRGVYGESGQRVTRRRTARAMAGQRAAHSSTGGTRKLSPSRRGAFFKMSRGSADGRTSSSRITLWSGMTWAVGGIVAVSSSSIARIASRIWD